MTENVATSGSLVLHPDSRKYTLPHALRGNEWFLDFSWISSPRTSTKTDIDLVFCQSFFLFHLQTINSVAKATKTREQLPRYQVQPSYTKHTTLSIRWNFSEISYLKFPCHLCLYRSFRYFRLNGSAYNVSNNLNRHKIPLILAGFPQWLLFFFITTSYFYGALTHKQCVEP